MPESPERIEQESLAGMKAGTFALLATTIGTVETFNNGLPLIAEIPLELVLLGTILKITQHIWHRGVDNRGEV